VPNEILSVSDRPSSVLNKDASSRREAITLRVNGHERIVSVFPETPFLYVLRNNLGLKGTRFGCGTGLCGACTVIVDGRPSTSCDLPTYAVAGHDVQTVEGLASEATLHPLQRAFIEEGAGQCGYCLSDLPTYAVAGHDVQTVEGLASEATLHRLQRAFIEEGAGQCGYCLSGILMSAKALLDRNPAPTEAEIRAALEPNICRCGAHPRILRAVRQASRELGR